MFSGDLDSWITFDSDGDGLSNLQEYINGTLPNNQDTDGDGLVDGYEVSEFGSDPLLVDSDSDGMSDKEEDTFGLNPQINDALYDADNDRYPNIYELRNPNGGCNDPDKIPDPTHIVSEFGTTTLQDAIDAVVNDFEIILIEPGEYFEPENVSAGTQSDDPKMLIISRDGPESTIFDGLYLEYGLYLQNSSIIDGITISYCYGDYGGAIYLYDADDSMVSNCHIHSNLVSENGGGIFVYLSDNVNLTNNSVFDNEADDGGGIEILLSNNVVISNNLIYGNTAKKNFGGAINLSNSTHVNIFNNKS